MLLPCRAHSVCPCGFYYLLLIFQLHIFYVGHKHVPRRMGDAELRLECITTFCGVTPQGQNTGVSPGLMVTASP